MPELSLIDVIGPKSVLQTENISNILCNNFL